jgi:hypothetical protein
MHHPFVYTEIRTDVLLPKPAISAPFVRALLHQPVVDFPLEPKDIFTTRMFVARAVLRCNLVKVLGQQPQYHRALSGTIHVVAIHRWPSVPSRHHKLLTRKLLPTYMQQGSGVIDHRIRKGLQGKN